MSNRASFIKFIGDNPDDLSAKLIFGDWLEESGSIEEAEWYRWLVRTGFKPFKSEPYGKNEGRWVVDSERQGTKPSGRHNGDIPDQVFENIDSLYRPSPNTWHLSFRSLFDSEVVATQEVKKAFIKCYKAGWRPTD